MAGKVPPAACGGAVGPGVGIQLQHPGPAKGRLLFIGHYGAYGHDDVWYSDDGGASYKVATPPLAHMDEAQLVELPSGDVQANMRTNHYNKTCDCRAVATSTDGGATFGPIEWVPELISPVCAGSVLKGPGGAVYFANPASKTSRMNGVIRRSADGVHWSGAGTAEKTVWAGEYAYSCLTNVPAADRVGLMWETDGPQCKPGSASCRTVFSAFPAAL
jgi:sialidase-1